MAIEKIKLLGAALEHHQSSPFTSKNGLNWPCCLASSSKTAPRILILSIVLGVEYSSYVKSIAAYAPPPFFEYNNLVLAIVYHTVLCWLGTQQRGNQMLIT